MIEQIISRMRASAVASTAITAHRFISPNGTHDGAAGTLGVSEIVQAAGEAITLKRDGQMKVEAGGVITAGDIVYPDSSGRAVKWTAPTVAGADLAAVITSVNTAVATLQKDKFLAVEAASAAGKFITVIPLY